MKKLHHIHQIYTVGVYFIFTTSLLMTKIICFIFYLRFSSIKYSNFEKTDVFFKKYGHDSRKFCNIFFYNLKPTCFWENVCFSNYIWAWENCILFELKFFNKIWAWGRFLTIIYCSLDIIDFFLPNIWAWQQKFFIKNF